MSTSHFLRQPLLLLPCRKSPIEVSAFNPSSRPVGINSVRLLPPAKSLPGNTKWLSPWFHSVAQIPTLHSLKEPIALATSVLDNPSPSHVSRLQGCLIESCHFDIRIAQALLPIVLAAIPLLVTDSAAAATDVGNTMLELSEFQNGLFSSFLLIIFSEIGDKTFFIAALLAARQSNVAVFTGTFGALAVMTLISVFLGRVFHFVDESFPVALGNSDLPLDDIAAVALLLYFGLSTLLEASSMDGGKAEEEKQEAELAIASVGSANLVATVLSVFALVFVAEWGDKSFFSTIALAAASSPAGVVSGAILGHGVATLLAVVGGSFLGSFISEKIIAYTGGILFLVFAAITSVEIWNKQL